MRDGIDRPSLGESGIGPLEAVFDRGPYPVAGAPEAVDQSYFDLSRAYPDPYADKPEPAPGNDAAGMRRLFEMVAGPSYRFVVDMGDLDGATIVQTTGQSGVPYDAHYGDLTGDWLANVDVPLPFTQPAVDRAGSERLTLVPRGQAVRSAWQNPRPSGALWRRNAVQNTSPTCSYSLTGISPSGSSSTISPSTTDAG